MILPELAPAGTDAEVYLMLGKQCAASGACWDVVRPVGAVVYFSLPYRLGLPAETIVVLNWALLALSVTLAARLLAKVIPGRFPFRTGWAVTIALLSHVAFMGVPAGNALSDVPAASLLLVGLELAALGWGAAVRWQLAVAGLSLGLAAFFRAFYLYPVLLGGLALVVVATLRHRPSRALWLVAPVLLPIAVQVMMTYLETARVSYLDPVATRPWRSLHLESSWFGYDTLIPAQPWPYGPPAGDSRSGGLRSSLRAGNLPGVTTLVTRRLAFYFGSWVPFGGVYLGAARERVFSRWILALHVLAAALALWWLARSRVRDGLELPLVTLGAILAEGLAIVPESRFVMALQAALWMAALAGISDLCSRAAAARQARQPGQP